jgi:hypothetical protein
MHLSLEIVETIHISGIFGLQAALGEVARQLNGRPRKSLGFETPAERYEACVAMTD